MLVNEFLEESAALYPNKEALICYDKRYSFIDIEHATNSFGNALLDEGFQRHDRVIVYLDNSVESVISIFGILKAGGIFVVVDPQVKANKLEYILRDCQAQVLISDMKHFMQVHNVLLNVSDLRWIIVTDFKMDPTINELITRFRVLSYEKILKEYSPTHIKQCCIDIDLASLIYTSGSSGNPKGVMLSHHNMTSAANSIIQYLENTSNDIIIDTLPLAFDYGLYQIIMAFKFGGTVVLEKAFVYPQRVIDLIIREKVTGWPIVPTIAAILVRLKNISKNDFSHLRYITSTAQALPPKHISQLREIFAKVKIYSMYGLTECKRVSYLPPSELGNRPNSVGKAIPNTEAYIVDEKGKEIIEARKPGELVVRGSNIMKGYWNLPNETEKALRPGRYPGDKVLYTGDLFEKDEEGYLYFLGRKDDIIKTAGHMVSPKEVENILCEREDVVEAAVVGLDDEILGKAIKAFVHLTDDSRTTEEEIIRFCAERLEDFAVPKSVSFYREMPKTITGKIQKRGL